MILLLAICIWLILIVPVIRLYAWIDDDTSLSLAFWALVWPVSLPLVGFVYGTYGLLRLIVWVSRI